jgi:hypothetical protein
VTPSPRGEYRDRLSFAIEEDPHQNIGYPRSRGNGTFYGQKFLSTKKSHCLS